MARKLHHHPLFWILLGLVVLGAFLLAQPALGAPAEGALLQAKVTSQKTLRLTFSRPVPDVATLRFRVVEEKAPDLAIEITKAVREGDTVVVLETASRLDVITAYRVEVTGELSGAATARPAPWALLLSAVVSAALINNFVFTRYLGLCIFFGVSKKRDTAVGMGATFLMVMISTAMASWAIYTFVLAPLHLRFLEILVFIGVVAAFVQALDTILRKINPSLHAKFGIYLMLITTNCIILAVPLLNAAEGSGPLESLALALGSGAGFALALFLMSCAREKLELARVPAPFQGLPIAFALAGMFALAFMGFSGLSFMR